MPRRSRLEILFEQHIADAGLPMPEYIQYKFHPTRKWTSDFCYYKLHLLVEVEGGTWVGGHQKERFLTDCEKYAEAQILGWRVLRIPGTWVHDGTGVQYLARLIHTLEKENTR